MTEWRHTDPLHRNMPGNRATALHRVIGLGSAKSGVHHWWLQRITAAALIPLAVWFLSALIVHVVGGHAATLTWLKRPIVAVPMILLLVTLFHHARLGLQVIIEDYDHSDRLKFAAVAIVHGGCYGLMITGIFATLLIVLG